MQRLLPMQLSRRRMAWIHPGHSMGKPAGILLKQHFRKMLPALGCIGLLIGLVPPSRGQELRWIVGNDDRIRIEDHGSPWDSIGQINITYSKWMIRCSGVLIAPNVVLTAAHCLHNTWSRKLFSAEQVYFVAGVHIAEKKGVAKGRCIILPNNYLYWLPRPRGALVQSVLLEAFQSDIAAIVLDNDIPVTPAQLAKDTVPEPGTPLAHAGYSTDRRQDLTVIGPH